MNPSAASTVDAVVIGAGFSGLSAARHLARAGRTVRVLEARDRVGGRTVNLPIGDGEITEGGGQYIGPTQTRLQSLADEYGIGTFPTYEQGTTVVLVAGAPVASPYEVRADNDLPTLITALQAMADEVPVERPWTAARAIEWDSTSVEDWIRAEATTHLGAQLLRSILRILLGSDPEDVSSLFLAYYIASAGNEDEKGTLVRLITSHGGAQDRRFIGGSHLVAKAMADELGDAVSTSSPVRRVEYSDDGVVVVTDAGTVAAAAVVVAIPPPLADRIEFDPPLPEDQAQLLASLRVGRLSKLQAVYDTPFWREEGLSGNSLVAGAPIQAIFENTPPGGRPGVLFAFSGGGAADRLADLPEADRRDIVLRCFADVVGERALEPREVLGVQWATEEWSGGGPGPTAGPGVLTTCGRTLRDPAGPIHWAGTERAVYWTGYLEGRSAQGSAPPTRSCAARPDVRRRSTVRPPASL